MPNFSLTENIAERQDGRIEDFSKRAKIWFDRGTYSIVQGAVFPEILVSALIKLRNLADVQFLRPFNSFAKIRDYYSLQLNT